MVSKSNTLTQKITGAPAPCHGPGNRIAVLIPCFNEEAAIGKVLADFRAALPEAMVYIYDNNSRTAASRWHAPRARWCAASAIRAKAT
jgi:hypothetical protein